MATSARSRQSGSTATVSRSTALPPYQPLAHPLNPAALHALHTLPQTHSLRSLKERFQTATNHLTEITGDLNDLHTSRAAAHARQAARKKADPDWDGGGAERRLDDAWQQVESMTNQMEESTRHVIDAGAKVEGMEKALRNIDTDANAAAATQVSLGNSLFSRSQRLRRPGQTQLEGDEDYDYDVDYDNNEQTPAFAPPPTETLKRKLQDWDWDYAILPPRDRYASHNAYIGFRKIVHDSRHPEDDPPPMPHASTWFSDPAAAASSSTTSSSQRRGADGDDKKPATAATQGGGTQDAEEDDEEEVTIARERRTLRCPLTLLPLHDPLSSTRCPHAFERDAILSMLATAARGRGGRGGGSSSIRCPECEAELSKETLVVDPVLVRKIRRIEERERKEREEEEEEEDDVDGDAGKGEGEGDVVTSSPVGEKGFGVLGKSPGRIKREKMSSGVVKGEQEREREVSCVPATQIVDMEDP